MHYGRKFCICMLEFAIDVKDAVDILDHEKLSPGKHRALGMPKLWPAMAPRSWSCECL